MNPSSWRGQTSSNHAQNGDRTIAGDEWLIKHVGIALVDGLSMIAKPLPLLFQ